MLTVIEEVVSPVLHNKLPDAVVDSNDVPQLIVTFITDLDGVVPGVATPVPFALAQPLTVVLTVYVPAVLTVIDEEVAPVLQSSVPVALVDSTDVPLQLFSTVTTGVAGTVLGAAVPVPAALVQPVTVAVTV